MSEINVNKCSGEPEFPQNIQESVSSQTLTLALDCTQSQSPNNVIELLAECMEEDSIENQNLNGTLGSNGTCASIFDISLDINTSVKKQVSSNITTTNVLSGPKLHQGANITISDRDDGIRFVFINNSEAKPKKALAYTNPVTRSADLQLKIGKYKSCSKLNSGSILVECFTFPQVQNVFKIRELMGMPVHAALATDIGTTKGYAHAPELMDMTTDLLNELWREQQVIRVDRKMLSHPTKYGYKYNASLIITFKCNKIPYRLPIGDDWLKVTKLKKKIQQCNICNKLHHKTCGKDIVCVSCGQNHSDCKSENKFCSNCKINGHGANDPECATLKREIAISEIRKQHKVGYAKAKIIFLKKNKNGGNASGNLRGEGSNASHPQRNTGGNGNRKNIVNYTDLPNRSNQKKAKRRKSNTAAAMSAGYNGVAQGSQPNSKVGQSWQSVPAKSVPSFSKNSQGKMIANKHKTVSTEPVLNKSNHSESQTLLYSEALTSPTRPTSPTIHNSQIAGASHMEVPKLPSKLQFPTHNKFSLLNKDADTDTEVSTPLSSPNRKKRTAPSPDSDTDIEVSTQLSSPNRKKRTAPSPVHPQAKKSKINSKKVTLAIKEAETFTPQWTKRNMATQTKPTYNEKVIIPTKYKNHENIMKKSEKKKDPPQVVSEETPEPVGIDYNNVDDIIRHLGKNVIKSGNLIFIVKLLGALISNLTKTEVDESHISQILTSSTLSKTSDP